MICIFAAVYGLFSAQLYMIAKKSRQETTSHTAAATGEKSGVGSTYLYLVVVVVHTTSTWLWFNLLLVLGCGQVAQTTQLGNLTRLVGQSEVQ